jgi:hypothetical protein
MGDAVRLPVRSIHGRYSTRPSAVTPQTLPRSGFVLRPDSAYAQEPRPVASMSAHGSGAHIRSANPLQPLSP